MTEFDAFVELLDYPMYVVTAVAGEERGGCLVGFAGQCSLEPARFAVWLSKANHTYRVARDAELLVVHLLPSHRHDLAQLFGGETGDERDKFGQVPWSPGPNGTPVLTEALAWFAGRIEHRADWGDHVGFSLAPIAGSADTDGKPLAFHDAHDIEAGHPA
ncbi:flavin reductase family protein [Kitasatospora sp. CMC57]|uniref:Flavin reductase family protein n=1 Tax=Kitasatospora sp. CMC57 TaxID=3231513 RepID=A0AB33JX73_9ACTN